MDFVLHTQLAHALESGDLEVVANAPAADPRDLLCTLLSIYEHCLAPAETLGGNLQYEDHPVIVEMRGRFERWLMDSLDVQVSPAPHLPNDVVDAVRLIAQRENDSVFDWLAEQADWRQMVCFLMVEGGPELGIPGDELPLTALFRSALNGLLMTNESLQPENLGALAMHNLQTGSRRHRVFTGLKRLRAPADAFPSYSESAISPRHGEEWLERVLQPLVDDRPEWGPGIVRGALWQSNVNARLYRDLYHLVATRDFETA